MASSPSRRLVAPALFGWLAAMAIAAVLIVAKWDAISRGPTSEEAITVITVAERSAAEMRSLHGIAYAAQLDEARQNLKQAWGNLSRKEYQQAIDTAHAAEKILAQLPQRN